MTQFGIGLTRNIAGAYAELIDQANALAERDHCPLLALDCPSGLDADTGCLHGATIRASHTITFIAAKPGLFTADGPMQRVVLADAAEEIQKPEWLGTVDALAVDLYDHEAAAMFQPAPFARPHTTPRWLAWLPLLLLAVVLAGCGSLPENVERPVSHALASPASTPLGQLAAARRPADTAPDLSGYALIDSANLAFSSRLALTQHASRTLDIQYYAIHGDESTARLLQEVRLAAKRGVRVRILLDDFNSTGKNALVMGMLLAALSVEIIADGAVKLFPALGH